MGTSKYADTSKIAALLAAIAAKRADKPLENADSRQREVQKSPPEQASAITPIYDDLVFSLLKKQEELKIELREPNLGNPLILKVRIMIRLEQKGSDTLLLGVSNEAMCRAFPSKLKGDAQLWFSGLTHESIGSFKKLSKKFTKYFATSRTIKRTSHCLKYIIQVENGPFKDFVDIFIKAARKIQGLNHEKILASMEELMDRLSKYIAIEEVEASKAANAAKNDKT
ncbi:uncharacterized protein G2W53_035195 [Senna tora]|uniref:Retrotransposon gag domain-containing protein n=1 Tax=Senna tora TaxID=362788 RepID=A0A834SRD7_9FABA|nr:uncharacterized protein G2W53_035195 [Senna tora]